MVLADCCIKAATSATVSNTENVSLQNPNPQESATDRQCQLMKYMKLDQKGSVLAEYIWIDGSNGIRTKTKVSMMRIPADCQAAISIGTAHVFIRHGFLWLRLLTASACREPAKTIPPPCSLPCSVPRLAIRALSSSGGGRIQATSGGNNKLIISLAFFTDPEKSRQGLHRAT